MEQNDLNTMLGTILSDPKAMEGIKQVAASLKGGAATASESKSGSAPSEQSVSEPISGKATLLPRSGGKSGELTALLLAAKPFLGKEKCKTVDDAVSLLKLVGLSGQTELLKSLSGLLS